MMKGLPDDPNAALRDAHGELFIEAVKLAVGDVRFDNGSTEQAAHVIAALAAAGRLAQPAPAVVRAEWCNDGTADLTISCPQCPWYEVVQQPGTSHTGDPVALSLLVEMAAAHQSVAHPAPGIYTTRIPAQAEVGAVVVRTVTDPRNPCHVADDCTYSAECEQYEDCVQAGPQCTECMQGARNDCAHFTAK